jgi:peroxiredoxin family protein
MEPTSADADRLKRSTIMLVSGDLDKALCAFEIAVGQAAMGIAVTMWFTLFGVNAVKRPTNIFSLKRVLGRIRQPGTGRREDTDVGLQTLLVALNWRHAGSLPLSQLNFLGIGPLVMKRIMKHKGMMQLEELIASAQKLGVKFRVCQVCVDTMACNVDRELLVDAEVRGASSYTLDVQKSHFNAVI